MVRSSKEITLPISKYKIKIYDYYLRGDRVAIEKIMTDAVEMTADGQVSKVDTGYIYAMEDKAVLLAIESIIDEGKEMPIEIETIHSLPEEDFEFLKENLPKEKEKKSTTKPSGNISEKVLKSGE